MKVLKTGAMAFRILKQLHGDDGRAQIAIEFISLLSVGLLISLLFVSAIGAEIKDRFSEREYSMLQDLGYSIQNELNLAYRVEQGYSRVIELPPDLDGVQYSVQNSQRTLTLSTEKHQFSLSIPPVFGSFSKGANTLTNLNGTVFLAG